MEQQVSNYDFVPVNVPLITPEDTSAVTKALEEGWISGDGPYVEAFERDFSAFCGRKFGVAVSNGTLAIDLLIEALGIGEGDEVILPSFTIVSCLNQVLRAGAVPVFIDSDPSTWNMDVNQLEDLITPKTKLIIAVHIYGLPVDMDPLLEIAKRHNIPVIEDAAESHGLLYKGRLCGSFGVASTFSFYANKNITTGEGGMVVSDDSLLAEKIKYLRNLCFIPEERFLHKDLGWNGRLTSLQAALGSSQLSRIHEIVARRKEIANLYNEAFKDMTEVALPLQQTDYADNNYWVYGMTLDASFSSSRNEVMKDLAKLGLGTRPFFHPLHLQPVLAKFGHSFQAALPVAEHIGSRGFYLPNGLGMTDNQLMFVVEKVREYFGS